MRIRVASSYERLGLDDDGFTMIVVILTLLVTSVILAVTFSATNSDVGLTRSTTVRDKAYYAALAGLQVYEYQLNTNPNYWTTCPSVSNVAVPSTTDESYSYSTLPATGHAACESGKTASVIETVTAANGTFRIKSTGVSAGKSRSIVATFAHPGFLNYVWLTNFEQEDPSTKSPEPIGCEHYYAYRQEHGLLGECPNVGIIGGEEHFNGPFHTNDASEVCGDATGKPSFGRNAADPVEVDGGFIEGCSGSTGPEILGTFSQTAPTISLPETSNELLEAAEYKFSGRTYIELKPGSPNTMLVTLSGGAKETKAFPAGGVIYVSNAKAGCAVKYSPFSGDLDYEADLGCGNVYIKGTYTESLTVAAANDIIITGNLTTSSEGSGKPTGNATLGLIATNFIRIYHPVSSSCSGGCKNNIGECNASNLSAGEDPRGWGSTENISVDAGILAAKHDWGVDNFMCGKGLGSLNVWGSIVQFWRGRTRCCTGGSGYSKSYNYDERLATKPPPSFLSPTSAGGWKVTRATQPPE
jgi:Tfp pilus assembly protein PilX